MPKEFVLAVLRANGVDVLTSQDDPKFTILIKGDRQESFDLPPRLKRNMLRALARVFDVPFPSLIYATNPASGVN